MPIPAVIANPTKCDNVEGLRRRIARRCAEHGFAQPIWLETTPSDPGRGQAEVAVSQGADVVMALGGDGTVRAVAEALVGTSVALSIIPGGTGNLLAHNVGVGNVRVEHAVDTALTGDDSHLDVGTVRYVDSDGSKHETTFLVMAGVGFDADIMERTTTNAKKYLGPSAYVVTGLQRMIGPLRKVTIDVDRGGSVVSAKRRIKTAIIGNCGQIFGGIELMPGAKPDDGVLDAAVISAQGILGWSSVAWQVLTKGRAGGSLLEELSGTRITVTCASPMPAQIDGDPVGDVSEITCELSSATVVLRVPAEDPVDSVLDPETTRAHANQSAGGNIDLRDWD